MAYEDAEQREIPRRSWFQSPWLALAMIGWLLYELTAQPAVGVVVCCLKFGWEDFRTALWLRRNDPHRRRGRACCCLYFGSGLWRVALIGSGFAILATPLFGVVNNAGGAGAGRVKDEVMQQFAGACLATLWGFILSSLATLLAVALALRSGCKLWLDREVHRARRENQWPPPDGGYQRHNQAARLILSSLIVLGLPCMLVALLCLMLAGPGMRPGGGAGVLSPAVAGVLTVGFLAAFPIGFLGFRDYLARRVLARWPGDCWDAVLPDGHVEGGVMADDGLADSSVT